MSDRTQLWIQNATLTHVGTALALPRIQFKKLEDGWRFLARGLEVSPLKDIVLASELLPDKASKIVRTLDPAGYIEAISLNIASLELPLRSWEASIVVADVTTQPYRSVPGLLGIDASVTANQEGAQAWILTKDFTLDLPRRCFWRMASFWLRRQTTVPSCSLRLTFPFSKRHPLTEICDWRRR